MKLSVRILDIDEHITDFHLSANPDGTEWKQSETEYAGPDFLLIFYVEPATLKIKDIKKGMSKSSACKRIAIGTIFSNQIFHGRKFCRF